MILETLVSDVFDYKKLSPEEQQKRGILGRLVGVIADGRNATRNGRKYSEKLWEHVFQDPIMQERIETNCCFGELGHPTDREETDMEKIAICMDGLPKKDKNGRLQAVFNILDTPNGRILKTLCDYGCKIGVSSRGSGEVSSNFDGTEDVDPDSYECQGWDAVIIPAVKEARLNYVTEELDKKRYNKTLRAKLQESYNKASADDKKIMKETFDNIGVDLAGDNNGTIKYYAIIGYDPADGETGIEGDQFYIDSEVVPASSKEEAIEKLNATEDDAVKEVTKEDYEEYLNYMSEQPSTDYNEDEYVDFDINEALEKLHEDDIHDVFRKDAKNQYKRYSDKVDAWNDEVNQYKEFGINPDLAKGLAGRKPDEFKLDKGHNKLERKNYPFYITFYEGTSYYHPEEGGYYVSGLEPYYSEGFNSFDEAQDELLKYLEENNSTKVSFNPNLPTDDDNYSYSEDQEEYHPYYDAKNRLIGAVASGKYIGEEEQIWIEPNRHYLKKQRGDSMYESLDEGHYTQDQLKTYAAKILFSTHYDDLDDIDREKANKLATMLKKGNGVISGKKLHDFILEVNAIKDESLNINEVNDIAVDNNEAMVEELQKLLKRNGELESKVMSLQEKLSVCYAKESSTEEKISSYKTAIKSLTEDNKKSNALVEKLNTAKEKLNDSDKKVTTLESLLKTSLDGKKDLKQQLTEKENEIASLKEQLNNVNKVNQKLNEDFNGSTKEKDLLKNQYEERLANSKQLIEKYKTVAKNAVDKYIASQAVRIGVKPEEIKNKLPESYGFKDIDSICEDLKKYKVSVGRLPFNTVLKENKVKMTATPSKNDPLTMLGNIDDDVDSQLLSLAKIN